MSVLVFLDCETPSLSPFAYVWEFAGIRVDTSAGTRNEKQIFIGDLDLTHADPEALRIGRFYERHPDALRYVPAGDHAKPQPMAMGQRAAAREIARFCQGATAVGSKPSFDTERLGRLLRRQGIAPTWNYRPVDVHTLMAAHLHADGATEPDFRRKELEHWASLSTDDLAERLQVWPAGEERHTALGDARWCERIWHRIGSAVGAAPQGGEE